MARFHACLALFTACFTTPKKDHRTLLSALTDFMPSHYRYNEPAKRLFDTLGSRQSVHLTEACAIAYYQQQTGFPGALMNSLQRPPAMKN